MQCSLVTISDIHYKCHDVLMTSMRCTNLIGHISIQHGDNSNVYFSLKQLTQFVSSKAPAFACCENDKPVHYTRKISNTVDSIALGTGYR